MVSILYTNSEAVRAALGIETNAKKVEIPDEMFVNQSLERQLRSALYPWLPGHADVIAAGDAEDAEDVEIYQADLLRNYCLYWAAWRVAELASVATRRKVGDGKSTVERFAVDWLKIAELMKGRAEQQQVMLAPTASIAFAARSIPAYDPVTNI